MYSIKPDLKRYPHSKHELRQAWDAADELILQHLGESLSTVWGATDLKAKRILVLNDGFGALACPLAEAGLDVTVYTESFVGSKAISINSGGKITAVTHLDDLKGPYDIAILRVPKNMSFYEDMLAHLSQKLVPGGQVISGYMVKHQAATSFELLAKYIGETHTSLSFKKARLIFAKLTKPAVQSPYPLQVEIEGFDQPFIHHSNLFSREKLDLGTRFLLENIPDGGFQTILDLGCGNGIVGIVAKQLNPGAQIIFSDESEMALESAKANYARVFGDLEGAEFVWTNSFENPTPGSLDLVICNPPFHQGNTMGDQIAREMFADASKALKPGGFIRVIGNTHLAYRATLNRMYPRTEVVATNAKFTIVDAFKSTGRREAPAES